MATTTSVTITSGLNEIDVGNITTITSSTNGYGSSTPTRVDESESSTSSSTMEQQPDVASFHTTEPVMATETGDPNTQSVSTIQPIPDTTDSKAIETTEAIPDITVTGHTRTTGKSTLTQTTLKSSTSAVTSDVPQTGTLRVITTATDATTTEGVSETSTLRYDKSTTTDATTQGVAETSTPTGKTTFSGTSAIDHTASEISTDPSGGQNSKGIIIGVTVSLVLVITVVIVILAVFILYKQRRRHRSNTPRTRKISTGVKRPGGLHEVDRQMIQHPPHIRKDSAIGEVLQQSSPGPSAANEPEGDFPVQVVINTQLIPLEDIEAVKCERDTLNVYKRTGNREDISDTSESNTFLVETENKPANDKVHDTGDSEYIEDTTRTISSANSDTNSITSTTSSDSGRMATSSTVNNQNRGVVNDSVQTGQSATADGVKQKQSTINSTASSQSTVSNATNNQQQNSSNVTNYQKPRKLSGPNNQVPKDLLSNWKNKFEGQQAEIFEEEEEEDEEAGGGI